MISSEKGCLYARKNLDLCLVELERFQASGIVSKNHGSRSTHIRFRYINETIQHTRPDRQGKVVFVFDVAHRKRQRSLKLPCENLTNSFLYPPYLFDLVSEHCHLDKLDS